MRSRKMPVLLEVALLLVALALSMGLAGCGEETPSETSQPTAVSESTEATGPTAGAEASAAPTEAGGPTGEFEGEIVIGVINDMTGSDVMTGAEQKWAYEKAAADINAEGGITLDGKKMKFVLKFVDAKSSQTEAAAAAEKLIKSENIKLLLGTDLTILNLAAASVCEKYEALLMTCFTWTDFAREQKMKWLTDLFFSTTTATEVPFNIVDLQPENERPQNWCVLTEDTVDGQATGDGMQANAEKHGYNVALYQTFTPGTKDFSSVILKMKDKNIDAVTVLITSTDGITFVRQMKEQNFSPKFIFGWKGFWPVEFNKALGPDADYIGHDGMWYETLPYPGCAELGEAFRADHDGKDSISAGLNYGVARILAEAIQRAGSTDPAAVREQVVGGTFKDTVMGDVTYDELGVADITPLGLFWKEGKRIMYWPDLGNKFEWFVPWDQR